MADRGPVDQGPQQDLMPVGKQETAVDAAYRDASYLGTDEADEEEAADAAPAAEDDSPAADAAPAEEEAQAETADESGCES